MSRSTLTTPFPAMRIFLVRSGSRRRRSSMLSREIVQCVGNRIGDREVQPGGLHRRSTESLAIKDHSTSLWKQLSSTAESSESACPRKGIHAAEVKHEGFLRDDEPKRERGDPLDVGVVDHALRPSPRWPTGGTPHGSGRQHNRTPDCRTWCLPSITCPSRYAGKVRQRGANANTLVRTCFGRGQQTALSLRASTAAPSSSPTGCNRRAAVPAAGADLRGHVAG